MARKTGSHSETTRPKVRAAALRLFARYGFAAVSMRQIASDVGVQAGALYLYTPDKQTLLFDLMRTHLDEVLAGWRAADPGGDPLTRLEAFARFHIRYHFEHPDEIFIAYMELRNLSDDNFAEIERLRDIYEGVVVDLLTEGQASGVFNTPDPRLAAKAAIAMLNGISTWFRDGGRLDRDAVEAVYWDMLRKSVTA